MTTCRQANHDATPGSIFHPDQTVIVKKTPKKKMENWERGSKIATVVKCFFFSEKVKNLENIEACWRTLLLRGITLLHPYPCSTGTDGDSTRSDGDVKKRMDRSGEMPIIYGPSHRDPKVGKGRKYIYNLLRTSSVDLFDFSVIDHRRLFSTSIYHSFKIHTNIMIEEI